MRMEHQCPVMGVWVDGSIDDCPHQCRKPKVTPPPAAPGAGAIILALCRALETYIDKRSYAHKGPAEEAWAAGCKWLGTNAATPSSPLVPAREWTRTKPAIWYEYRWADEPEKVYRISTGGTAWADTAPEHNNGRIIEFRGPIPPPLDPKGPGEVGK